MPYIMSEETKELLADTEKYCDTRIKKFSKIYDESGQWPRELYEEMAAMGYSSMEMPEKYGGLGLKYTQIAPLIEEISAADAGVAVTICASGLALKPILLFGSEYLKEQACGLIAGGGYGAFCLTEPQAGSDAGALMTTAEETKDGYIISGSKCFVTNGGYAAFYTVFAKVIKDGEDKGISAFFVKADTPGVCAQNHENKMGIRLSDTCDVIFDKSFIPKENLIGICSKGMKIAMSALNHARATMACAACGIARRSLSEAADYARKRQQFGRPIAENQAIQMKLAKMDIQTEAARQLIYYAFEKIDRGLDCAKEAAMAKYCAAQAAVSASLEAIQIMGGYGYSREFPSEKLLRDAKIFQIFEGTDEMMLMTDAKYIIR